MKRISLAIVGLLVALTFSVDGYCSVLSALGLKGKVKKVTLIPIWDSEDRDDGYEFNFTPEGVYIGEVEKNDESSYISSYDRVSGMDIHFKNSRMSKLGYDDPGMDVNIDFTEYNSNNLPIRGRMEYELIEYVPISWTDLDSHGNYQLMEFDRRKLTEPNSDWCPIKVKWKIEYWPEGVTSESLPQVPQGENLKRLIEKSNKKDVTVFSDSLRMLYTEFMETQPNTPIRGIDSLRIAQPFIELENREYFIHEAPDKSSFSVQYIPSEFDNESYWLFSSPGVIDNSVWFNYIPVGDGWRLDDVYSTYSLNSVDVVDMSIKDELTTILNINRYSEIYPAPRLSEEETERILSEAKNDFEFALQCSDIKRFQKALGKLLSINYNPEAQYLLGYILLNGIGLNKNHTEAFKWFSRSAEQENMKAQHYLGIMYLYGAGVEKNPKEAEIWLNKSVNQGNEEAEIILAEMYLNGEGVKKNKKKAKEVYTKYAERGDLEAQYKLSQIYEDEAVNGPNIYRDLNIRKWIHWLEKSADQGHPLAEFRFGNFYQYGEYGWPKDYEKALYWYKRSAEHGNTRAENEVRQIQRRLNR
ncbi:MAG: sel1 repeat family protein [Muribaculaceae bacterium]|nr:sel1 repeat family protein [Muribaculaceae bacterium]